jgi:ribosomal protein L19
MNRVIAVIVEGHAEVESAPVLLRRMFAQVGVSDVQVARPFRVKRNRVVKAGELERAISLTLRDRVGVSGIMVLLDSDDPR